MSDYYVNRTTPVPYNFGAPSNRPIRNRHMEADRAKMTKTQQSDATPKMQNFHRSDIDPYTYYSNTLLGKYGIVDMKPGEVKTIKTTSVKAGTKLTSSLQHHARKNPGWFVARLRGSDVVVTMIGSIANASVFIRAKKPPRPKTDMAHLFGLNGLRAGQRVSHTYTDSKLLYKHKSNLIRRNGFGTDYYVEQDGMVLSVVGMGTGAEI